MRVLVTGATGFVGRSLCVALARAGHSVLAHSRRAVSPHDGFSPGIEHVSSDYADIGRLLVGVDSVAHLGGLAHRGTASLSDYRAANRDATLLIQGECERHRVPKLVYLSSAKVHGDGALTPYTSDSPFLPQDDYAVSKVEAEVGLESACRSTSVVSLRPPVVYGPGPKANIALLARLARTGLPLLVPKSPNRRSFIGIDNLCGAVDSALESNLGGYRGFVISDGAPASTAEFFELLATAYSQRARFLTVSPWAVGLADSFANAVLGRSVIAPLMTDFWIDDDSFTEKTGWRPLVSLRDGIQSMVRER